LTAVIQASFDDIRSRHIRLLHEASKLGPVTVVLPSDSAVRAITGHDPKFPQEERVYLINSIRYVSKVAIADRPQDEPLSPGACLVEDARVALPDREEWCRSRRVAHRVLGDAELAGFPPPSDILPPSSRKKVIVTGCFDWFHSGHVAFFEEVSRLGDLIVSVGNDRAITGLKGKGHPMLPQEERVYAVGSVRHVALAIISSGMGHLDAEPEIQRIRPDILAVNEDGDRPEKRALCAKLGIEYRVLKRIPHPGLPPRESTKLRGF